MRKTISLKYFIIVVLIALNCCKKQSEIRKIYYDNGRLKAELVLKDELRNGYCKYYYLNGNPSYEGEFINNLRTGKHLDYFKDIERVESEIHYVIENGKEIPIKRIKYNEAGVAIYESNLSNRKFEIQKLNDAQFIGDTLKLKIKILNPKHDYTDAFIGNIDEYLNPLDSIPIQYFGGTREHEAIVSIPLEKPGLNVISGFIRDLEIKPINDSIGVTVADDTYFKYSILVKDNKAI